MWRLGVANEQHASLSYKSGSEPAKTAMVWRTDGTRMPGPRTDFHTWSKSKSKKNIKFGDRFIQFGKRKPSEWRMADINDGHASMSFGGRTAVIFRNDGTIHPGPRGDYSANGRKARGGMFEKEGVALK